MEFSVTEDSCLLEFLLAGLSDLSRNNVKSLLKNGEVLVDGRTVTQYDHPLGKGQTVKIIRSAARSGRRGESLKIIYEDSDLIAVNKPAGLLSVGTGKQDDMTAYRLLTDYVRGHNPKSRVFIVHRLDRDTSGVLLMAKNERYKLALQDNWNRLVTRRAYIAIIQGHMTEKSGSIRTWLKETKTRLVYSSRTLGDGLEAITDYLVIKENADYSMLEINLETGRKNQIRVHMKESGHCVVGDRKYGANADPLGRLGLHAHLLKLNHPFSGEAMRFEAGIPECFQALFNR